ncbi:MAG: hypothetical protein U1A77_25580 [Pirellulales bacterium]
MQDKTARLGAVISIALSVIAIYYTRAQGPYFYAQPHQMSYWTVESNLLTEDKKPKSGSLTIQILNNSETPARDVTVVVRPLSPIPKITCSERYRLQDGVDGTVLVILERVPARMSVKVSVLDEVTQYRKAVRWSVGPDYLYSAYVIEVQTEFGAIQKNYLECKEFFVPLPDDKGAHEMEEMKTNLKI